MNKLIRQLMNKLEFQINELSLNILSNSVISLSIARVRNKIKRTKLEYSTRSLTQFNYALFWTESIIMLILSNPGINRKSE